MIHRHKEEPKTSHHTQIQRETQDEPMINKYREKIETIEWYTISKKPLRKQTNDNHKIQRKKTKLDHDQIKNKIREK